MIAFAPVKVILLGEHAVVYDKLGIVYSLDKRCNASVLSVKKYNEILF